MSPETSPVDRCTTGFPLQQQQKKVIQFLVFLVSIYQLRCTYIWVLIPYITTMTSILAHHQALTCKDGPHGEQNHLLSVLQVAHYFNLSAYCISVAAPLLSWLSCRLWLSRNTPLSLWSFSPSGDVPSSAARALDSALFCLHELQLARETRG